MIWDASRQYLYAVYMKNCTKQVVFIVGLLASTLSVAAQKADRTTDNLPVVGDVMSAIRNATGWTLQDNGIWYNQQNCLPNANADNNRTSEPSNRLGRHNFEVIELREVMVHGRQYVVMLTKSEKGRYEFSTLRYRWIKFKQIDYHVFKAEKLRELMPDSMIAGKTYLANLDLFTSGSLPEYDDETYLVKIAGDIQHAWATKTKSAKTLLWAMMRNQINGKWVMRFRPIEVFNKKNIYFKYFDPENQQKLLKTFYYEVPLETYSSFVGGLPVFDALIVQPNTFLEYFKRGIAQYDREDYNGALQDFDRAIKADPLQRTFLIYAYMGSSWHQMKNFQRAEEMYNIAFDLKPDDQNLISDWYRMLYNRGLTRLARKDRDGACADFYQTSVYGIEESDKLVEKYCK